MSENNKSCGFRTSIGGQALIEGILMRGPKKQGIVCRTEEGLVEKEEDLHPLRDRFPVFGWPLLRGCVIFVDSLVKGMQALTYSASLVPLEEQGEPDKIDQWITEHFPEEKAAKLIIYVAVVLGVLLSVFLFIVLPTFLVSLIKPLTESYLIRNLSEGLFKVIILIGYMAFCGFIPDVRRTFQYHGAEHKSVHCHESGLPLTPENAATFSRLHPRCGTAFLLIVFSISILLFLVLNVLVPISNFFLRFLFHLAMLPIVAGISYEVLMRLAHSGSRAACILRWPGMQMQRLTTREPDEKMLECAIVSVNVVLNGIPSHAPKTPEGWAVFTDYHESEPGYVPPVDEETASAEESDSDVPQDGVPQA